jgi:hypothetical protein
MISPIDRDLLLFGGSLAVALTVFLLTRSPAKFNASARLAAGLTSLGLVLATGMLLVVDLSVHLEI